MLKKIRVEQAAKGMYIQKLEGSWMDHNFWRTRFLIQDDLTLEQLRNCGATEIWIDVSQGEDIHAEQPAANATLPLAARRDAPPLAQHQDFRQELQ